MGPRLFRRGNSPWLAGQGDCLSWLQWGHVFSDVEIGGSAGDLPRVHDASMGPRLFRRGNLVLGNQNHRHKDASMGPRLFRRGNIKDCSVYWRRLTLQWGHVFSDVEIKRGAHHSRRPPSASMGPRLFRRGNQYLLRFAIVLLKYRFNGATSFQTWK